MAPAEHVSSFSAPAIDMNEDEKAYKITAELPGLDTKDVDLSVSGNTLVVKGEKRQEKEEKDRAYAFPSELTDHSGAHSNCRHVVVIATGHADYSKGVLTITLPKTADAQKQAKKIEVKSTWNGTLQWRHFKPVPPPHQC